MPRYISSKMLKPVYGIELTPVQLWRLSKAGKFPKPVKISPGRNSYLVEEIEAHLRAQEAAREAPRPAA